MQNPNQLRKRSGPYQPVYAVPVASNKSPWFVLIAVLAGLAFGGFLFYQFAGSHPPPRPAAKQPGSTATQPQPTSTAATPPAAPETTAPPAIPAPKAIHRVHVPAKSATTAAHDITPPVLLSSSQSAPVQQSSASPMQPQPPPSANPQRRRAVQDPGAAYSPQPLPASPPQPGSAANASAPSAEPQNSAPQSGPPSNRPVLIRHPGASETSAPPQSGAASPTAKPASTYTGPGAGIATWTGKLEKNETLTITGAAVSAGTLSGAGLPGVPVRVTVDQSNLGIVEMPSASNNYNRLVIRSHSKHDKITIHWTVIE